MSQLRGQFSAVHGPNKIIIGFRFQLVTAGDFSLLPDPCQIKDQSYQ